MVIFAYKNIAKKWGGFVIFCGRSIVNTTQAIIMIMNITYPWRSTWTENWEYLLNRKLDTSHVLENPKSTNHGLVQLMRRHLSAQYHLKELKATQVSQRILEGDDPHSPQIVHEQQPTIKKQKLHV